MIFAALMLFSTTGVAIYHHICGCPVPMAQTAEPAGHNHSCCAVAEIPTEPMGPMGPTCCTDENHDACDSEHPDKCKNEVTYLKAPIIFMMPVQELAVSEISFEMPDFRMPDAGSLDESIFLDPIIHSYVLPPRAGGSLVILLHSIKIPSPEDIT
ncbi:MAG: hypothetical protein IH596_06590 [Bacteroidales bacterium]|nr:hypothetical protein [Bacteroidales bacterium]